MPDVEAILLGTAQDAGVPQVGCDCRNCRAARRDRVNERLPVSLGLVDHSARCFWMIDATPAFPQQVDRMRRTVPDYKFSGLLLTHAHMGHYTGLVHFGKEGWNRRAVPLFASHRMLEFLEASQPWRDLLRRHFEPVRIIPDRSVQLSVEIAIRPVAVPHRAEYTDTMAFWVETDVTKLFYCPDIDSWDAFPLGETLDRADLALLDATFFSADELPGRDLAEIPHPFVPETLQELAGRPTQVWLIHLNHSNPLCAAGPERDEVEAAGAFVPHEGQRWELK